MCLILHNHNNYYCECLEDYVQDSYQLLFGPGQRRSCVTIILLEDDIVEPFEEVRLVLSAEEGPVVYSLKTVKIFIADINSKNITENTLSCVPNCII